MKNNLALRGRSTKMCVDGYRFCQLLIFIYASGEMRARLAAPAMARAILWAFACRFAARWVFWGAGGGTRGLAQETADEVRKTERRLTKRETCCEEISWNWGESTSAAPKNRAGWFTPWALGATSEDGRRYNRHWVTEFLHQIPALNRVGVWRCARG